MNVLTFGVQVWIPSLYVGLICGVSGSLRGPVRATSYRTLGFETGILFRALLQ